MKKIIYVCCLLLCSSLAQAQQQKWAIGFKIGEPTGLSVRHYSRDDSRALETNLGVYGGIWGVRDAYKSGAFDGSGIAFNVKYLIHHQLISSQFRYYYGVGGQLTSRRYYVEEVMNGKAYQKDIPATGLGGLGTCGIEYFSPSSPLSVFAEAELYVELIPAFFYIHPQGGIGARFNF